MTTQYLFDHRYAITIGPAGGKGLRYGNIPDQFNSVSPLRVVFDIDRTLQSTSNKAKFQVYNLSANTRKRFEQKGMQVQFDAGYDGLVSTIFIGDVAFSNSKRLSDERKLELGQKSNTRLPTSERREGGNIITTFECGDGEKFLLTAHLHKKYAKGTPYLTVLQDIANIIGVNQINVGQVLGLQTQTFSAGLTIHGHLQKVLDYLCSLQNLEWSIQNQQLQIVPKEAHTGDQVVVLTPTTGLLGVPTRGSSHTEWTCLLNPQVKPGGYVQIISENINDYFKVRRAKYEGDTHGTKWTITCEGTKVKPVQALTSNSGKTLRAS